MQFIEGRPGLGHSNSVGSRVSAFMAKMLAVVVGGVVLASAFVLSLVLFAIACAVLVIGGGYLWWKTRELRKQIRAQMDEAHAQRSNGAAFTSNVIEGVVISRSQSPEEDQRSR